MKNKLKRNYTAEEDAILRKHYANTLASELAEMLNRNIGSIYYRASKLGLKKDIEFTRELSRKYAMDSNHNMRKAYFQKGHVPFNKGLKQEDFMSKEKIELTKKTRFKKGQKPPNTIEGTGHIRIRKSSGVPYKWIKIADSKWELYHTHVWENKHGKLAEGLIVVFKDGDTMNCDVSNLEAITRSEHFHRNQYNRLKNLDKSQVKRAILNQIRMNKNLIK